MDETGLSWAFLDEAPDPSVIVPSHHVVVGSGAAVAVAVVVDITDDSVFMCSRRWARWYEVVDWGCYGGSSGSQPEGRRSQSCPATNEEAWNP